MLGRKKKLAIMKFSHGILTTFGKLDQQDVHTIDGNTERLVTPMMEQYGWQLDDARSRVDLFRASLTKQPNCSMMTSNHKI